MKDSPCTHNIICHLMRCSNIPVFIIVQLLNFLPGTMIDKKSPWPYPFVDLFLRETIFEMQLLLEVINNFKLLWTVIIFLTNWTKKVYLKFLYILDFVSKTFHLFYSVKIKNIIMFYNTIFLQSLIFLSQ